MKKLTFKDLKHAIIDGSYSHVIVIKQKIRDDLEGLRLDRFAGILNECDAVIKRLAEKYDRHVENEYREKCCPSTAMLIEAVQPDVHRRGESFWYDHDGLPMLLTISKTKKGKIRLTGEIFLR